MFTRTNTLRADEVKAANHYIEHLVPELTVNGQHNDDLHGRRYLRAMLGELEQTLPDTFHIVRINYDCAPVHGTESIGVLLLVPAVADDPSSGPRSHQVADRLVTKAFNKVCGWHPDDGGLVLSTYGVLPDGTLTINNKEPQ